MGKRKVLGGRPGGGSVIPVDAKEAYARHCLGEARKRSDRCSVIERDLPARQFLARQEDGALGKDIAGVHEDSDPVHGSKEGKRKRLPKEPP